MNIRAVRADPAGNITILVTESVLPSERAAVAAAFLAMPSLSAEQVGFIVQPKLNAGAAGRLEMMGGEFCGNAARAFGLYLAKRMGEAARKVMIEISGCDHPIAVMADPAANTASAQMPLPLKVLPVTLAGIPCIRVEFEGIAHLVADCPMPNDDLLHAAAGIFEPIDALGAYGVIFFDRHAQHIIPAVTVKATKSLIWEGSCGSGSVAAAIAATQEKPDGDYCCTLSQPAGSMTVTLAKAQGTVCRAEIGGAVTLGEPKQYFIFKEFFSGLDKPL